MPARNAAISSRVTNQNPRPRKYASAAERQKALRERFPTLCVRVEQEQADFMKRIADEQGRTLQDVHLAFIKYANGRGNLWLTQGLKGFAPLPRFEEPKENPMKRKPTPAQIAARERFAEMARSGAFKRKAAKARKAKANPLKKAAPKRNPRASNPIILVSDKLKRVTRKSNPQTRRKNPMARKSNGPFYYALVPDDGGFSFGMDSRTPVQFVFSNRDRTRGIYRSFALPNSVTSNPEFQQFASSLPGNSIVASLDQLRNMLRKYA